MKLKVGDKAPEFILHDQDRSVHELSQYKGSWVLLYFYPKDDTPGCTKEACSIRDNFVEFKNIQAQVLGVSVDTVESHAKFSAKYKLPFPILSDDQKDVVKKYDVWGEKTFMGKSFMGTKRTSFLIDPKGIIRKIYEDVKPEKHAKEVIEGLKMLQAK